MLLPLLMVVMLSADTIDISPRPATLVEQGAAVSVHRQPAVPLVALRLALVADDPPGHAGAGHLVQHLIEAPLNERAGLVGARVQLERTADAVVFTVTGPSVELDYMAGILRDALTPRWEGGATLAIANRQLREERLAEWERAEQHVRSSLRLQLFPNDLSAAGTERSAERLTDVNAVRTAWEQMYHPERVSITAVGDVDMQQVSAAFGELPAPPRARSSLTRRDTASSTPLARAQATNAWVGRGYLVGQADPAVVSVATRVAARRLRTRLPAATVVGEHWWTHHGQALVLVASAPGPQQAAVARTMQGTLASVVSEISETEVSEAASALRRELLFQSRTPDRMASILGVFADRTGDSGEAQRFYERLGTVTRAQVRAALRQIDGADAVEVQIEPQRLIRR